MQLEIITFYTTVTARKHLWRQLIFACPEVLHRLPRSARRYDSSCTARKNAAIAGAAPRTHPGLAHAQRQLRHRLRHVASVQDTELRLFQQLAKWRNIAEHGRQARAHRFDGGDAKAFMTRQANIVARLRHQLGQLRIAGIGDDADAFGNSPSRAPALPGRRG